MAINPRTPQHFYRTSLSSEAHEIQEVSIRLKSTPPPTLHLVTPLRPTPRSMSDLELSFRENSYSSHRSLPTPQPHVEASQLTTQKLNMLNLQHSPRTPILPLHKSFTYSLPFIPPPLPVNSKNAKPLSLSIVSSTKSPVTAHPFQESPNSMMTRKPELIPWIKYPVEAGCIHPRHRGPDAAVGPCDGNNNSHCTQKAHKKGSIPATWGPQKLKCLEKSRKSVRFASTWGPARPAHPARLGEYATINPRKLSSKYVRPALFNRPNLKD